MPSRMSRYHNNNNAFNSRCERNENLYKDLYSVNDYSNIAAVSTLEKNNQIEFDKIREMIKDRESYIKQRELTNLYKPQKVIENKIEEKHEIDEKNYDIKDALNKAKEERKNNQNESYKKNQYDYLLNSNSLNRKNSERKNDDISSELKEIINTITNNADLNKLSNSELSLDLLDDLKSNTISGNETESTTIKKIIDEEKKRKQKIENENIEMDNSFYTKSFHFNSNDFDDDSLIKEVTNKKSSLAIKIILAVILVLITLITIYVVYINIKSI